MRETHSKFYIEKVEEGHFGDQTSLPNSILTTVGFVGREDYLDELHEAYQNGGRCFALYGSGGIGKTELAKQFAEELGESYQAKVAIDMNGLTQAVSCSSAMLDIIWQFERAAYGETKIDVNAGEAAIKSRFREFTNNPQTLILLDNAAETDSVKDITGVRACLIVTSRRKLDISGDSFQILKMSEPDAVKLLLDKDGKSRIGDYADALAKECDCLPLALAIVKSLLLKRKFLQIEPFIEEFKKEKLKYLDAVTASFNLSYQMIGEELQKRWRQLAVFPVDFTAEAAAAIWDVDLETAERRLEELEEYSLIEIFNANENVETGEDISLRIRLHDLIRAFTATKLSGDEQFDTQFCFARYYASILLAAQIMQEEQQTNHYAKALKLIDTEWINITAGQKWTAEFIESSDAVAHLCTDYSGYARDFVTLRLHPRVDIIWLESGLKAARQLGDRSGEGNSLGNLGIAYDSLGEYRKAIEYYEQALKISREIGDRSGEGNSLGNLGNAYHSLGDYRKAIEYYEQALKISREIGDRSGEGNSLGSLGNAYHSLGDYRKAIDYHEQSLAIKREIGDRSGEGNSLGNLGNAYHSLGEKEKACELWKEALAIFEAIESPNANVVRQWIGENCEN